MSNYKIGYIVFEIRKKSNKIQLKQISILFNTKKEAVIFIDNIKEGIYYKSIHPNYDLQYCEIKYI